MQVRQRQAAWRSGRALRLLLVALGLAAAQQDGTALPRSSSGEDAPWRHPMQLDYGGCAAHLQASIHEIRDAARQRAPPRELGEVAAQCARERLRLSSEAGLDRPAAFAGEHVPTLIMPTRAKEFPELPPFYFVLPFWDMVVSNRVRLFGSYDHGELAILKQLLLPGQTFVDVGANVGALTVPLAAHVGEEGFVYAFEPFRQVFQYLNANVAVNGLSNVQTEQAALSDASSPAQVRAPAPTLLGGLNVGMYGVFKGDSNEPNVQTSQLREKMEDIAVRTLDSYDLPGADLLKIDVEGHARNVILGSLETIKKHRPVLWFEDDAETAPEALYHKEFGYWCTKFTETTEHQFICVPWEKHEGVQARLNELPEEEETEQ